MTSPRLSQITQEHSSTYAPSDDVIHNGEAWASVSTSDPWDPAILACDGGGIRGYSSLIILQRLMHEVALCERKIQQQENGRQQQREGVKVLDQGTLLSNRRSPLEEEGDTQNEFDEDKLLPCHYFDYMYGTSTGGLIATLLGRLRMSVPQCLKIYRDVGDKLFGVKNKRGYLPLMTRYHHKPLEKIVRQVIQDHCKQHPSPHSVADGCAGDDWHPWDDAITDNQAGANFNAHICQSVCLTAAPNSKLGQAHLLRTFNHNYVNIPNWLKDYNNGADRLRIWEATRATSAAPFYFDALEVDIQGEKQVFKDGGIRENNPAVAAWTEFVSMYGEGKDPALLLSIGTGRPDESKDGFANTQPGPFGKSALMRKAADKMAVFKNVLIKYTEGEEKHREMLGIARGEHTWYKRLNVSEGLEKLALDDWRFGPWKDPDTEETKDVPGGQTLTSMEDATNTYLARDVDVAIDSYAPPRVKLQQIAEKLVRQRRAREATRDQNPMRWDTYMGRYLTGRDSGQSVDGPICHKPEA